MRKRTKARELSLQVLYQLDLRGDDLHGGVEAFIAAATSDPEILDFARLLITGAWERRAEIDRIIEAAARNWEIRRMAAIDRNILRLATFELLHLDEVPPLVTINEAIDMAKKYSTKKSGHFVNGILDHIRTTSAPEAKRRKGDAPPPEPGTAP
jgi:transcription antitermination factor NusB